MSRLTLIRLALKRIPSVKRGLTVTEGESERERESKCKKRKRIELNLQKRRICCITSVVVFFFFFPSSTFLKPFRLHYYIILVISVRKLLSPVSSSFVRKLLSMACLSVCLSVCLSIHVLHASLKLRSVYNASLCLCLTKYDSHYPVSLVLCMSSTFVDVFFCSSCACFFYQNFLRFFFFCSIMALEFSFSLCGDHSWWVMIMKIKKKQQKIIQMW